MPQFPDPLNMQFVEGGVCAGLVVVAPPRAVLTSLLLQAVQEHGSAGQTGLVVERLLRGLWWLQAEKVQLVLRHLGCVMTLLTHRESYGFFQRDVKNIKTGHHLALLISTCMPLTKGKNDAGNL